MSQRTRITSIQHPRQAGSYVVSNALRVMIDELPCHRRPFKWLRPLPTLRKSVVDPFCVHLSSFFFVCRRPFCCCNALGNSAHSSRPALMVALSPSPNDRNDAPHLRNSEPSDMRLPWRSHSSVTAQSSPRMRSGTHTLFVHNNICVNV